MFCDKCNIEFTEGLRYCKWCGGPLIERSGPATEPLKCPSCSGEVGLAWAFCKTCGQRLDFGISQAQAFCTSCGSPLEQPGMACSRCSVQSGTMVGMPSVGVLHNTKDNTKAAAEGSAAPGGWFCPSCGGKLESWSAFCNVCGRSVTKPGLGMPGPDPVLTRACSTCSAENPPEAKVCRLCGTRLSGTLRNPRLESGERTSADPKATLVDTPAFIPRLTETGALQSNVTVPVPSDSVPTVRVTPEELAKAEEKLAEYPAPEQPAQPRREDRGTALIFSEPVVSGGETLIGPPAAVVTSAPSEEDTVTIQMPAVKFEPAEHLKGDADASLEPGRQAPESKAHTEVFRSGRTTGETEPPFELAEAEPPEPQTSVHAGELPAAGEPPFVVTADEVTPVIKPTAPTPPVEWTQPVPVAPPTSPVPVLTPPGTLPSAQAPASPGPLGAQMPPVAPAPPGIQTPPAAVLPGAEQYPQQHPPYPLTSGQPGIPPPPPTAPVFVVPPAATLPQQPVPTAPVANAGETQSNAAPTQPGFGPESINPAYVAPLPQGGQQAGQAPTHLPSNLQPQLPPQQGAIPGQHPGAKYPAYPGPLPPGQHPPGQPSGAGVSVQPYPYPATGRPGPQKAKKGGAGKVIGVLIGLVIGFVVVAAAGYGLWRYKTARANKQIASTVPSPTPIASVETQTPEASPSATPTATPSAIPEGMVLVPAGIYTIGREGGDTYSSPVHQATLQAFYIDTTEVTNAQYKRFVDATNHKPPESWTDGNYPVGNDNYPVVDVSWKDASAYAAWADKRLPTEEEWEAAARGPEGLLYPWGNDWRPGAANIGTRGIVEVGSFKDGASPFGALDMIGNVWEWTPDDFKTYPANPAHLPYALTGSVFRVIRGGAYDGNKSNDATYRGFLEENKGYPKTGFRCVKTAENRQEGTAPGN